MSNEHNPIAQLIAQLQHKWNSDVTPYPELSLVRWLIIPEQARLYEGFLKLESTPHGSLPDMVIVLLTQFSNKKLHSQHLINDWIDAYKKDEKTLKAISEEHSNFKWNIDEFEAKISDDTSTNNKLLVEMLQTFQEALPEKDRALTLALFPYSVESPKEYAAWIDSLIKLGLPTNVRFMIFDYSDERYFDPLLKTHEDQAKSLAIPLDLDEAISKIASSGDPNKPDVLFRQCMLKMSKAVTNNNLTNLHKWGKKGLEATQRSGIKSLYATAHIVYAGMLFSFKEFELIDDLLQKGLAISKQGLKMGDDACKPILIQFYGFQASSKQLQKKKEDAANLFCKQADTALEHGFAQQPLTAWWMASSVIKKKDKQQYKEIVTKAYNFGNKQEKETLQSSCMGFIASDYYTLLDNDDLKEECIKVDDFMKEIDGDDWRDEIETRKKEMEKRKLSLFNWF